MSFSGKVWEKKRGKNILLYCRGCAQATTPFETSFETDREGDKKKPEGTGGEEHDEHGAQIIHL